MSQVTALVDLQPSGSSPSLCKCKPLPGAVRLCRTILPASHPQLLIQPLCPPVQHACCHLTNICWWLLLPGTAVPEPSLGYSFEVSSSRKPPLPIQLTYTPPPPTTSLFTFFIECVALWNYLGHSNTNGPEWVSMSRSLIGPPSL